MADEDELTVDEIIESLEDLDDEELEDLKAAVDQELLARGSDEDDDEDDEPPI